MNIQMDSYTAQGDRRENEDSFLAEQVTREFALTAVADGLGGHGGGKAASQIAAQALSLCRSSSRLPDREEIARRLDQANQEILSKRDGPSHMKTTAVFLAVQRNRAVWAHIGDSRLYHFDHDELAHYTLDHSMCQLAVKLGEITRDQIPDHPDRSRLLRVLGESEIAPEFHDPVELRPGRHAFLLCTDGLWERLAEAEICLDLQKSNTPGEWLDYLRRRAQKRKWTDVDNNTAVAVFVEV